MAVISVRLDDVDKKRLDDFCRSVGIAPSTILKMFAKKVGTEQRLPFEVKVDPFYSAENIAELERRAAKASRGIGLHEHELIED
jgi:DNA-damage-inducible protein J